MRFVLVDKRSVYVTCDDNYLIHKHSLLSLLRNSNLIVRVPRNSAPHRRRVTITVTKSIGGEELRK